MYPEIPSSEVIVGDFVNDYNTGYAGTVTNIEHAEYDLLDYIVLTIQFTDDPNNWDELSLFPETLIGVAR